jgi:CubicO group peptidase (beta-lactamase class C family)
MSDHRKPPQTENRSHPSGRVEHARPSKDAVEDALESTTVRLKSLRLRRREQELLEAHRVDSERKADEAKRATIAEVERPSGRVRHDERGMAVWDWAVASGEFHTLSATSALKKLEVTELKIEETARVTGLSLEPPSRDKGGGFDPYNQRDKKEKKK